MLDPPRDVTVRTVRGVRVSELPREHVITMCQIYITPYNGAINVPRELNRFWNGVLMNVTIHSSFSLLMKEALCIGISDYPPEIASHPLKGCARDAADMALLFLDTFEFDKVTLVTNGDFDFEPLSGKENLHYNSSEKPTRSVILNKLTEMAQKSKSQNDVVVFYFSGHGICGQSEDKRSGQVESILTLTGDDKHSVVVDCELRQKLRQIEKNRHTKNVVSILDACHSSGMYKGEEEEEGTARFDQFSSDNDFAAQKKVEMSDDSIEDVYYIVMAACRDTEQSKEGLDASSKVYRGYFTSSLTWALRIPAARACSYESILRIVTPRVSTRTPHQTPTILGHQLSKRVFSNDMAGTLEHPYSIEGVNIMGGAMHGIVKDSTWILKNMNEDSPDPDLTEHKVVDVTYNRARIENPPASANEKRAYCVSLPPSAQCAIKTSPAVAEKLKSLTELLQADRFFHMLANDNEAPYARTVLLDVYEDCVVLRLPESIRSTSLVPPKLLEGHHMKPEDAKIFAANCHKWFEYDRTLRIRPSACWQKARKVAVKVTLDEHLDIIVANKGDISICPIVVLMRMDGSIMPSTDLDVVKPGHIMEKKIAQDIFKQSPGSPCVDATSGRIVVRVFLHQYEGSNPVSLDALSQDAFFSDTLLVESKGGDVGDAPINWDVRSFCFKAPRYLTDADQFSTFVDSMMPSTFTEASPMPTDPLAVSNEVWESIGNERTGFLKEHWNIRDRPDYKYLVLKDIPMKPFIAGSPSDYWWTEQENNTGGDLPIQDTEGVVLIPIENQASTELHVALMQSSDVNFSAEGTMCSHWEKEKHVVPPHGRLCLTYKPVDKHEMSLLVGESTLEEMYTEDTNAYAVPLPVLLGGDCYPMVREEGMQLQYGSSGVLKGKPLSEVLESPEICRECGPLVIAELQAYLQGDKKRDELTQDAEIALRILEIAVQSDDDGEGGKGWFSSKRFPTLPESPVLGEGKQPCAEETEYVNLRKEHCALNLKKYLSTMKLERLGEQSNLPTISFSFSGGGYRAMIATIAVLDYLSESGLLGCATYTVGLSGSTWALSNWQVSDHATNPFVNYEGSDPWEQGVRGESYQRLITLMARSQSLKDIVCHNLPRSLWRFLPGTGGKERIEFWGEQIIKVLQSNEDSQDMLRFMDASQYLDTKSGKADRPFPICTMISTVDASKPSHWFTYTPFEVSPAGLMEEDTRRIQSTDFGNRYILNDSQKPESYSKGRTANYTTLRFAVGMWGSAFVTSFKEQGVPIPGHFDGASLPSWLNVSAEKTSPAQEMFRDAGLCHNIPLAPLVDPSSRKTDLVLTFDFSAGVEYEKPGEWEKAVDWFDQLQGATSTYQFPACVGSNTGGPQGCRYRHPEGSESGPSIFYIPFETTESTFDLAYNADQVKALWDNVQHRVKEVMESDLWSNILVDTIGRINAE